MLLETNLVWTVWRARGSGESQCAAPSAELTIEKAHASATNVAGKFSLRCASCGAENRTTAKFCDSCGTAFGADGTLAAPAVKMNDTPIRVTETSTAENLEGERKTVTALFADIKGSMDLIEDLDPEEARAIVDPALKLMIAVVHQYDGYVAQPTGDGIFALFGAPVAHEDHPQGLLRGKGLAAAMKARRAGDAASGPNPRILISRFLVTRSDPRDERQLAENGAAATAAYTRAIAALRFIRVALRRRNGFSLPARS